MFTASFYRLRLLLERLSKRERYLLLIILFSGVLGVAQLGLIVLGLDNHDSITQDIERLKQETSQYQNTLESLVAAAQDPRRLNLLSSNEALQRSISELDARIEDVAQSLMTPSQMVRVVQGLLEQEPNLSLLSFEALPVIELETGNSSDQPFYQHGIAIELQGQYEALLSYLTRIEQASELNLFWQSLQITTERFPELSITIQVHTLSRDKEWLNV